MNKALWALQFILGAFFVFVGAIHFALPDGLPTPMRWMYELSPTLHYVSGTAEILGGLGLILPGLLRIQPRVVAAAGLAMIMIGAAAWHFPRGGMQNIANNVVIGLLLAFVAYGRWEFGSLTSRDEQST